MEKEKKKKKGGLSVILWIVLFLLFAAGGYFLKLNLPSTGHNTVIETRTLKSELVKISELATYQKEYREVITKEKDGFFSKRFYATFDGVIKAGINMENADVAVKMPEERDDPVTVEVTLPDAEILTHTDDNWDVVFEDGYQGKAGDERNELIKERKKKVEKEFIKDGGLDKASEKAKKVIEDFIRTAYGEEVVVTFNGEEAE